MKVTGSEPYVTPEHIVDSRCMLQWGACVCTAIKKCSFRVPTHPSAARGVEDTALTEEGQTRSVGSTAASGDRGTGQEEYPVQADQGHQGPHRDREVSSTHHLITPLIPSPHCHSFQPPTSCPYTPTLSMQSLLHYSVCLLPLLPPFFVQETPGDRSREGPAAEPSDSTAAGPATSQDGRHAASLHTLSTNNSAHCCMCAV